MFNLTRKLMKRKRSLEICAPSKARRLDTDLVLEGDTRLKRSRSGTDDTKNPCPEINALNNSHPEIDASKYSHPELDGLKNSHPEIDALKNSHPEINALNNLEPETVSPKFCQICLDQIQPENLCVLEICGHWFCFSCAKQWGMNNTTCPLCRHTFRRMIFNIRADDCYDLLHRGEHYFLSDKYFKIFNFLHVELMMYSCEFTGLGFKSVSDLYYQFLWFKIYLFYQDKPKYSTLLVFKTDPFNFEVVRPGLESVIGKSCPDYSRGKVKFTVEFVKGLLGAFEMGSREFLDTVRAVVKDNPYRLVTRLFATVVGLLKSQRCFSLMLPSSTSAAYFASIKDFPTLFPNLPRSDRAFLKTKFKALSDIFWRHLKENPGLDTFIKL